MKKIKLALQLLFPFILTTILLYGCAKTDTVEDSINREVQKTSEEISIINDTNNEKAEEEAAENQSDTEEAGTKEDFWDIPSTELVKEIKIGWNLGNTLDATGGGRTMKSETSWGNPKTTKKIFDMVKEAGFNAVRIPTSWGNHLGPEPDYTIDAAWLDRVQEIVDYAYENELYTILNLHHEEWHFPSNDNYESAKAILTSVWSQIADRFEDYDEHLIFEGMNEPRMKGTSYEWNGGNEEGRKVVSQLNTAFIDTVRNSGGNNPLRHLMIPTYAASSDPKTWNDFILPEDDNIIVSIHAYTPYHFALNAVGTAEWSMDNQKDTWEVENLMNNLYDQFVSKGYPVIIGEFGAKDKNNLESRAAWAEYYIRKASEKGIPCFWWDNGAFYGDGELFGLLNRRTYVWQHPEIIDALMKGLE